MGNFYITEVESAHCEMHSAKVIMHRDLNIGEFKQFGSMKELDAFAKLLGFQYQLQETWGSGQLGKVKRYAISHTISDPCDRSFWALSELPPNCQKVTLYDNGHKVTCYFINDGATIHLFRPNPNARELHRVY